jgi:hypothetical protein
MNHGDQKFRMMTSGMNASGASAAFIDRHTVPRLQLNLQVGNITGIPSALGLTDGGQTTKYYYKASGQGDIPENQDSGGTYSMREDYHGVKSPMMGTMEGDQNSGPESRL